MQGLELVNQTNEGNSVKLIILQFYQVYNDMQEVAGLIIWLSELVYLVYL